MKRLITIILAIIMTLFTAPNRSADQQHVTAEITPQTEITISMEQVHDVSETTAETAFVGEVSKTETAVEIKETTVTESEVVTEESMTLCAYNGKIPQKAIGDMDFSISPMTTYGITSLFVAARRALFYYFFSS